MHTFFFFKKEKRSWRENLGRVSKLRGRHDQPRQARGAPGRRPRLLRQRAAPADRYKTRRFWTSAAPRRFWASATPRLLRSIYADGAAGGDDPGVPCAGVPRLLAARAGAPPSAARACPLVHGAAG